MIEKKKKKKGRKYILLLINLIYLRGGMFILTVQVFSSRSRILNHLNHYVCLSRRRSAISVARMLHDRKLYKMDAKNDGDKHFLLHWFRKINSNPPKPKWAR